ncbi:MAG: hypothetical protein ACTSXY_12285 [Promethearchaeota archaeon]
MIKKKIKLNHKCSWCEKDIYIGEYVFYKGNHYHIVCLLREQRKEVLKIIKLYFDMCMGARKVPKFEELKAKLEGKW